MSPSGDFERDISRSIGAIEASIKNLEKRAEEDRKLQNQRHTDNQAAISGVRSSNYETRNSVERLTSEVKRHVTLNPPPPLPQINASRARVAFLASVGLIALWLVGHALEAGLGWLVQKLLTKFGGL